MSSFTFQSTAGEEVLRIARASTDSLRFRKASYNVITRMIKQGASIDRLRNTIVKTYRNHIDEFSHLVNSQIDIVSMLFSTTPN